MKHSLTPKDRLALLSAAEMLRYPDTELEEMLPDLRGRAGTLDPEERVYLETFLDGFEQNGVDAMRTEHVRTFDLNPRSSLNMAWHRYGDDPRQGKAFAALNGLYRDAGFEPISGELPDHLPRMLEFMSVAPDWADEVIVDGFGPQFVVLRQRLEEDNSVYSPVLAAVCAALKLENTPGTQS